ncbi:hypothetical protein ACN5ZK_11195 [Macrococcoides bohemicum]|uniref:hypothetical protein n=1 Tax=Macrococcoides bohemicum TaxID=1903056 RepID=UPI003AFFA9AE
MTITKRIITSIIIIFLIAAGILYSESPKEEVNAKPIKESILIKQLESKEYKSGQEAMDDFRKTFFPDNNVGAILNPDEKSNPKFYSIIINKIDENDHSSDYAYGYAIQNQKNKNYKLDIIATGIQLEEGMTGITKKTVIGNTVSTFYAGHNEDDKLENYESGVIDEATNLTVKFTDQIIHSTKKQDDIISIEYMESLNAIDKTVVTLSPPYNPKNLKVMIADYEMNGNQYGAVAVIHNSGGGRMVTRVVDNLLISKHMKTFNKSLKIDSQQLDITIGNENVESSKNSIKHEIGNVGSVSINIK